MTVGALGGGGGRHKKPQPIPVMNVTPLVDIALVVLIIFMVIIPMMEKGFWLNVPKKDDRKQETEEREDEDDGPLVVTIDSRGVIRANKAVLRREDFPERLPRMLAAQDLPIVFFDAADNVPYGTAVEVMDMAKANGAKAIAMLTERVAR